MGHRVSYPVVAELLHELDYSLQANRKTEEGDSTRTGMRSSSTSMVKSSATSTAASQ